VNSLHNASFDTYIVKEHKHIKNGIEINDTKSTDTYINVLAFTSTKMNNFLRHIST